MNRSLKAMAWDLGLNLQVKNSAVYSFSSHFWPIEDLEDLL
jgi:hypothetical protein